MAVNALVSARQGAPCADERDIIVPPVIVKHRIPVAHTTSQRWRRPTAAAAAALPPRRRRLRRRPPPTVWPGELFAAGTQPRGAQDRQELVVRRRPQGRRKCYSQGRAAIYAHHANRTGFWLRPSELSSRRASASHRAARGLATGSRSACSRAACRSSSSPPSASRSTTSYIPELCAARRRGRHPAPPRATRARDAGERSYARASAASRAPLTDAPAAASRTI